jgi:hypothetical protein
MKPARNARALEAVPGDAEACAQEGDVEAVRMATRFRKGRG